MAESFTSEQADCKRLRSLRYGYEKCFGGAGVIVFGSAVHGEGEMEPDVKELQIRTAVG